MIFSMIISFISSMFLLSLSMLFLFLNTFIQIHFPIMNINSINLSLEMIMDWMSLLFSSCVLFISSMILMFSFSYIHHNHHKRFLLVLLSFVISMILLIFSNNIFIMMLGWDGLGLSSYALVIFYMDTKSKESGSITILSNRIGDILIIISIGLSFSNGIMNFFLSKEFSIMILILLIIAASTKSAQFPFMSWLPAAMAAPTPISALVHSSTLVTAGTFILIRLINYSSPLSLSIILTISSITILLTGISANWEQDFKKIIALSTLSQMAMIMFAISIFMPLLAFFHLITHAMFKSTMFLCAGMIIHNSQYQDIRAQGLTSNWSPSLISSFNISNMSLMGMPFLSGFYSKDAIMESFLSNSSNLIFIPLMIFSIGLTTAYSFRLLSFSSKLLMKSSPDKNFHNDKFLLFPSIIMIPMSMILGNLLSWFILPSQYMILSMKEKMLIPLIIIMGILTGMILSFKSKNYSSFGEKPSSLWFLNFLSSYPTLSITHLGHMSFFYDKSWTENFSASGSKTLLLFMSNYPDLMVKMFISFLLLSMFIPFIFLS